MTMYPNRNNQNPNIGYDPHEQVRPYDSGDDSADFQGTLLDPYWGNQPQQRQSMMGAEPKSRLWLMAGALAVAALAVAGVFMFIGSNTGGDVPVVTADATPYKTKPANPGGIEIPFQDKLVFNRLNQDGEPVQAEQLLPPAEQPMELALQPKQREESAAVPPAQLATQAVAKDVQKQMAAQPQPVATQPVVDVIPETKMAVAAPTQGAVPPPVTDVIKDIAAEPAPAPKNVTKVVSETPVAAAPVVAPKAETPKVEAKKPAATTPMPAVSGGTRVQLASIPDKAAADRALTKLQSQWGSTGAKLALVKADIPGKGTYWRVQSQPMNRDAAQRVCNTVKASGGVCIFAK
jgi:hypothetical protein